MDLPDNPTAPAAPAPSAPAVVPLSAAQWLLLFVLAAIQLSHVLDFILIMPLATHLEADLALTTSQFGWVVSIYGFAAGLAGLLLAPWMDRFDRKWALLVLYAGFTLGTLLCAFAHRYEVLLLGRAVAGAFGGVVAAVVLAIVGDAFPPGRRGTAMGVVMSAFSVASTVGVPVGLLLADWSDLGWRAPFAILGAASGLLLLLAWRLLPAIRTHLEARSEKRLSMWEVATLPAHLRAFAFTLSLVLSSFVLVPYLAAFVEKNVGRPRSELPLIYIFGGVATLVTMNIAGRLSDRFDRLWLFRILGAMTALPFLAVANLPSGAGLAWVLAGTTALMIVSSARMVPAMALLTSATSSRNRGSFLSVNASVQQIGLGVGPLLASLVMSEGQAGEPIVGYPQAGLMAAGFALVSVVLAGLVRADEGGAPVPAAAIELIAETVGPAADVACVRAEGENGVIGAA